MENQWKKGRRRTGSIPDCRFLSESGFSEFKDSQDSAAAIFMFV
jgi:hypothetical protein